MLHWAERIIALLTWLVAPAFTAWVSIQTHTSTSTTCINSNCTSHTVTTSDWLDNPLQTIAILIVLLVIGLIPAGLIYAHSRTLSGGVLATMWILVPILALSVYGFAFTWMGSAAFYWGAFMLLGAIVGSIRQLLDRFGGLSTHRSPST